MKKTFCFLLTLFFCLISIISTTSVKADVVIDDNETVLVNDNANRLGQKLAILESFPQLLDNGYNDISFENIQDVDGLVDYVWNTLDDALQDITDGINDFKDWQPLTEYKKWVINRGAYLATQIVDADSISTDSLANLYSMDSVPTRVKYETTYVPVDGFKGLSRFNRATPEPTPDTNYMYFLDYINKRDIEISGVQATQRYFYFYNANANGRDAFTPFTSFSWYNYGGSFNSGSYQSSTLLCCPIIDAYITSNDGTYYINYNGTAYSPYGTDSGVQISTYMIGTYGTRIYSTYYVSNYNFSLSYSGTLEQVLEYLKQKCKNINIYVDGIPWSIVSDSSDNNPNININDVLKIIGNNPPVQYEIQPNTSIDYKKLYEVILQAILDGVPVQHEDITYYDSHDTQYSPTIINNYYQDGDSEDDFIDSLLNYAVIPEFDTAIASPLEEPFVNGMKVMTIVRIFPEDILMVLGASFFLILFVAIIKRMIE